jgi:hypothetical protein
MKTSEKISRIRTTLKIPNTNMGVTPINSPPYLSGFTFIFVKWAFKILALFDY